MSLSDLFPGLGRSRVAASLAAIADQDYTPGQYPILGGVGRATPWGPLQYLAVGVHGVVERVSELDLLVIWWVEAEHRGHGDVSRYLDGLPRERSVMVMQVVNPMLAGMLRRRGFTREHDDTWLRVAA